MVIYSWKLTHETRLRQFDVIFQRFTLPDLALFMNKEKNLIHINFFRPINTMQYIKKWPVFDVMPQMPNNIK